MQYSSNPLIAYFNINSLQNKVDAFREITKNFPLDIFCIDEPKLDDSFSDHQFKIDGYHFPPFQRDRNNLGCGKIVYIKDGLIVKRINEFETNILVILSIELTISNKKWFIMFAYRPPNVSNKPTFFNEVFNTLNKRVNKYDNILINGDLNIDFSNIKMDTNNYYATLLTILFP